VFIFSWGWFVVGSLANGTEIVDPLYTTNFNMEVEQHRRLDWLLPSWLEDATAYDQSIDEDMVTVYYTFIINIIIFLLFFLFFSWYRRDVNINIYSCKRPLLPDKTPPLLTTDSYFGWCTQLYAIDDEVVIDKGGFDAMFLLRFYRLAFKIFFCFAFYGWGILVPVNVYVCRSCSCACVS
jgi:hypothetical protein